MNAASAADHGKMYGLANSVCPSGIFVAPGSPYQQPPDLADVRGHPGPVRALIVAAAGGHNLYLEGQPGTGKTMLARRLPGLLPPLGERQAIEVSCIHSAAGISTAPSATVAVSPAVMAPFWAERRALLDAQ